MKKPANLISLLGRVSRNQLPAARRLPRLLNPEVRGMATRSLASTTSICEPLRRQIRGVTEIQLSLQSLEIKTIVATQEDAHVVEDDVNETKRHLNVVFIGHVDAGKSTTGGQILFLSGQVDDRTILTYEKEAKDKSRESWFLDYSMDTNEEERVKGKTVEVGRAHFETEHTRFTILDVPDPKSYVPNMISGASQADIGVLVISARKGEFESGYERGQTCEHVLLAKSLGVDKLVVLINNMDEPTVKWSKERYDEIEAKMVPFLKSSGYNVKKDVQFLPISGLVGTNMNTRMDKSICSWWDGPCLFEVLDCIEVPFCDPKGPVRTILDKYKDMGMRKIESGTLSGVQERNLMAGFVLSSVEKVGLGSYHNRHFSRPFSHLPHQKESEAMPPQDSESQKRQNKTSLVLGNNDLLMQKIEDALSESKQELDKSFLEHRYSTEFRPSLSCNCLLLPEGLSSKSTAFLHHQHHKSTRKDPQYISAYELMIQRVRIQNDDEWAFFWNHIINNRVFIVETWDSNVGNIETLNYDYGIKGFHKGEVDASYHDGKDGQKGKARISFVIWKEDQVISAERYEDLDCDSIHEAEAYAVMALFFKCFELEIKELVLWTDNSDIQGCISGSYTVKQKKKQTPIEEHRMNLLLLLRCIVKRFTQLRSFCKPRELMFLADDLASPSVNFPRLDDSLRKFKYHLSKKALFKFSLAGSASAAIKTFAYNMSIGRHCQTKFFVLVDHMDKMEAVNQIRDTLCPCSVYLAIHLLDEKPEEFQIQIKQMTGANLHHGQPMNNECTIIHQITKYKGEELVIVMDGCLHQHSYDVLGRFIVILISSMEQKQLDPAFKELNALSFRYFNGVVA